MRNFYPRSPCGERLQPCDQSSTGHWISIHALLAESDPPVRDIIQWEGIFLSTLSLRRATLGAGSVSGISSNFYPRSPCGERLFSTFLPIREALFLSTLSLRRATYGALKHVHQTEISIHALLAESDPRDCPVWSPRRYFYPRSPCGERLQN